MRTTTCWPAVAAGIAASVVGAAYVGKLPPALPLLKSEFGLSLVAAGWVVSMFNTIAAVGAVFFGVLADRVGSLRFCLAGLVVLMSGSLLGATAGGALVLLVSRFLEGAGFIALTVATPALLYSATIGGDRRLALGLWSAYMPFGFAVAVLVAPFALETIGWRGLWIAVVAATAVCLAALVSVRGEFEAAPSGERSLRSILEALRQPGPWWVAAAMGCYTAQWMSVMVWLPTFLLQARGVGGFGSAVLTALVVGVNVPGTLTGTWLLQRRVPRGAIISAAAVLMAMCGLVIFWSGAPDGVRYAACLALSYLGGAIPPAVITSSQAYARSQAQVGTLQGLIIQGSNLGQFVGPPAVAMVVSATGRWEGSVYVFLAAAAATFVAGRAITRLERRLAP